MRHYPYQYGFGYGGGSGTSLIFDLPLLTNLTPVKAVNATITEPAMASVRMVEQNDGRIIRVQSGEARFPGSRRVENLLALASKKGDVSDWTTSGTGTAINDNGDGTSRLTFLEDNARVVALNGNAVFQTGMIVCFSFNIRYVSGEGDIQVRIESGTATEAQVDYIHLDNTDWRRIYVIGLVDSATSTGNQIQIRADNGVDNVSNLLVDVGDALIEEIGGAAVQVSADYVNPETDFVVGNSVVGVENLTTANGNTKNVSETSTYITVALAEDAGIVTEAAGANLTTLKRWFAEPETDNELAAPLDFTNAAWVKVNGSVAADAEAAPDGREIADAFTATSANATILDALTISSTAITGQIWLKRKTGSGTIEITVDGGSTFTTVTVTSSWVEFDVTQTLANPSFGIRIVTDTDAVYLWGGQVAQSSNKSTLFPANGTREADEDLRYHEDNFALIEGSFEVLTYPPISSAENYDAAQPFLELGTSADGKIMQNLQASSPRSQSKPVGTELLVDAALTRDIGEECRTRCSYSGASGEAFLSDLVDGVLDNDGTPRSDFTTYTLTSTGIRLLSSIGTNENGADGIGISMGGLKFYSAPQGETWVDTI